MAINLASIRKGKHIGPPRIVFYGPHGLGKSAFGAEAPKPIFICTEEGTGTIDTSAFPLCKTFADFMECIATLYTQDHDYQTVVIDSADWLEPLVWKEACRIHGFADIEAFGYGKGYKAADDVWRSVLDGLDALRDTKGMQIIITAHCHIKRFDSPETEPYDRYSPKLHERGSEMIQEWCDALLFTNYKTVVMEKDVGFNQKAARGISLDQRMIYTTERPAFKAKNRYDLPAEMVMTKGNNYGVFAAALAASMMPAQVAA